MISLVSIKPSNVKGKKMTAIFNIDGKKKTVQFGASGYSDYTVSPHDEERKKRYIARHRKNENWKDPLKAGTLSRYILWEYTNKQKAIKMYKKRFEI
jgi:hypothetical protein